MRVRSRGFRRSALAGSRRAKLGMQRLDAVALQPRAHALADLGRDRRHRRQPARQRLEIEAGAADEDRQAALARAPPPAPLAASATQRPAEKFTAASTWP